MAAVTRLGTMVTIVTAVVIVITVTIATAVTCFRYAESLQQLDIGKKIPPSGWKCERCDLTTNLWLNLTDGAILCGRKYVDISVRAPSPHGTISVTLV